MSTSTDFKTLEIPVNGVNSYIPPIIINEADNDGRNLKFIPLQDGQPVTGFTSARLYYDPRPKDAYSVGGYIDGTQDGDGWTFVIPANTFTVDMQGNGSVSFTDSDGETYTRNIQFLVESGGTKALSQGSKIDQLVALLQSMVNDFTMTAEAETGAAGSQANVTVTRLPSGAYNLNFTIPQGVKGDPGDLTTVAHDATLTGDGTSGTPLGVADGTAINPFIHTQQPLDMNDIREEGYHVIKLDNATKESLVNAPDAAYATGGAVRAVVFVSNSGYTLETPANVQVWFNRGGNGGNVSAFMRIYGGLPDPGWMGWNKFAFTSDIPSLSNYVPLSTYRALEAKVQALEVKTKVTEITTSGTDLHSLFDKTGTYVKLWGTSVVNAPTEELNSADSEYAITVVSTRGDGYMQIAPMAGPMNSYYCTKNSSGVSSWYKIQTTRVE